MKVTYKNRIKLWWHCLLHFHRGIKVECKMIFPPYKSIYCYDCKYGKYLEEEF